VTGCSTDERKQVETRKEGKGNREDMIKSEEMRCVDKLERKKMGGKDRNREGEMKRR